MKNLLKIALVFAIALFVSMSVKAQNASETATGTITVNVIEKMELLITNANPTFTYDEVTIDGDQNVLAFTNTAQIKANVNWTFSVKAAEANFNGPAQAQVLPVSVVKYSSVLTGGAQRTLTSTSPVGFDGTGNQAVTPISWGLDNLANQFAGSYTVGVSYILAKR